MKLKISLLALVLSLTLVGCSNEENNKPEVDNNNEIQNEIDSSTDQPEEESYNKEEIKKENIEFKIYTADIEDTNKIVEFETITVNKNSSVEYKLNELINIIKKDYFKGDVNLVLESIDANNIATINLIDQEKWSKHFQGSTGGAISQATIVETLLQRDYEGEWIKGIKILVDGKDEEIFNHAPFGEIFYK